MKKTLKYFLGSLFVLVVITIITIPFIPAEQYRVQIETLASQTLGVDTSMSDIGFVSLPTPGITIKDLHLSDNGNVLVKVKEIRIVPKLSSLFAATTIIRKIHLSGVTLRKEDIASLVALLDSPETSHNRRTNTVHVKRITAEDSIIQLNDKQVLGPIKLDLALAADGHPLGLELSLQQQTVNINLNESSTGYQVTMQATDWKPALKPMLEISNLKASGQLLPDRLHLEKIIINAYKGEATGNLIVNWKDSWKLDSRFNISSLNLGLLLKALGDNALDGTTSGNFTLRSLADSPTKLIDNSHLLGDAMISNGHIYNADLEQAVRTLSSEWQGGGQTPFDVIKSHVDATPARIRLRQLEIKSSILAASGKLDINKLDKLNGTINVGLQEATGLVNMPLMIAGTVENPKVRPTDEALAGAAVGTALLGPGIGTAAGVKAGEFLGKIGSLFGSDEEETDKDSKK